MSIAFTIDPVFEREWPCELAGVSAAVQRARDIVRRAAHSHDPVLITAERGFDPETIAREVHSRSNGGGPFLVVDVATIHPDHAESYASEGTLFLGDLGELPARGGLSLAGLLGERKGGLSGRHRGMKPRIIASAAPGLEGSRGRIRGDLYRHFQRFRIDIPPLRDRPGDIAVICRQVLDAICRQHARPVPQLTSAARTALASLPWLGNLDELHGTLERILGRLPPGAPIRQEEVLADLQGWGRCTSQALSLREARLAFERDYVAGVLERCGWSMPHAARVLGMERANLYRKVRQLGIRQTPGSEA